MRKFLRRIRFIFNIKRFLPFLFAFFRSREVSTRRKLLSCLLLVGYIVFPFDVIPDFLSFFGILDDLTILTLVLQQIVKMSPQHLKDKYGVLE
ncbi:MULTISPECIES: YkvA family protein [Aneurinibacillus]|uniref:YkvA family protein n=1 Tax=Aneurinibacillus TaxID=55079 RepID=UPI0011BF52B3|nr:MULTISPECIES: DUF1232 domain-containing protein [Aneurinibacillus]